MTLVEQMMSAYGWNNRPYKHQLDAFQVSKDREFYAYFMEMGTGKTFVTLMNTTQLYIDKKIKALVVVAPKSVYRNWAEKEIPEHISKEFPYTLAVWTSYSKKQDKENLQKLLANEEKLKILVINIEAFTSEKATDFLIDFLKKYPSLMVIDESTTIKNPSAKRTKIAINVGKYAKYRRICSGNPIPNGPLDLWSQAEFLKKNATGYNFFAFRNRFAILQDRRFGAHSFKQVVGYRDTESLKGLMAKFSFIIKKADCLDLPPKIYQTIEVQMNQAQTAAYNQMLADSFIKLSAGGQVTAVMVITQLMRLHQIACGFIKPDHGNELPFPGTNERMEALLEVLDQAPGKVIIWANYRYNIVQIVAGISEKFGKETVVEYYGDTSEDDRRKAKVLFQDPESKVRFIVSNPDTGRFGNTWTQGTTVIYYSNSYNLESREQSEDRAHRIGQQGAVHTPGQDPSVLYVDLVVKGSVDEKILKILKAKKRLTDSIVTSNWEWLIGTSITNS